ncbi:Ca(2+)-dependent cysteine protease [Entomophthora muscae]|uniref:Ca(2+)-dependent cysteine protease n=1 Tax=Entomophthora muscae TaxID=34485 RepID=A0ACC2TVX2_9FUNG|nr:Ca(2+)-dependent cysteine protease [Entomophthora muscae]
MEARMEKFEFVSLEDGMFPPSVPRRSFQNPISMYAPGYMPLPSGSSGEFKISRLTGQKKALIVGINYFDTTKELKECIDDAHGMRDLLISCFSFPEEQVVLLTDDDESAYPTKKNIVAGLKWLVKDAQPNDSLVFHYSGHSMRLGYSSSFGLEEAICPIDAYIDGYISGRDIHRMLIKTLPAGCRLTIFMDCCNSRPSIELAYEYDDHATLDKVFFPKATKKLRSSWLCSPASLWRFTPLPTLAPIHASPRDPAASLAFNSIFPDVLLFSGCRNQLVSRNSYTPTEKKTNLLTKSIITILTKDPYSMTYRRLFEKLRKVMKVDSNTLPRLNAAYPLDPTRTFIL